MRRYLIFAAKNTDIKNHASLTYFVHFLPKSAIYTAKAHSIFENMRPLHDCVDFDVECLMLNHGLHNHVFLEGLYYTRHFLEINSKSQSKFLLWVGVVEHPFNCH